MRRLTNVKCLVGSSEDDSGPGLRSWVVGAVFLVFTKVPLTGLLCSGQVWRCAIGRGRRNAIV